MGSILQSRLYDGCAELGQDQETVSVDVGAVLENLLLFDRFILQSIRLKELPALVRAFGLEGFLQLLKSGAMAINCEAIAIAQTGHVTDLERRRRKGALPLGSYSFSTVRVPHQGDYIRECFGVISEMGQLTTKQKHKLRETVGHNLVEHKPSAVEEILAQLKEDLRNNDPTLRLAIPKAIQIVTAVTVDSNPFTVRAHPIDEDDFRIESNVRDLLTVDEHTAHKIIEMAALGVAGRNRKLVDMRHFGALTSFQDDELPLFERKLDFLAHELEPNESREALRRVIHIAGLPDFGKALSDGIIDIGKFLKIRETQECRDFRTWLLTVGDVSDKEIEERITDLRGRLGGFVRTPVARALRFVAATGIGLIPGVGQVAGAVGGALDGFVVERVLPVQGPVAFLNTKLPSMYTVLSNIDDTGEGAER